MINLTKYNFTDEDEVWEIEEQIDGTQEFMEDNNNRKGYVTFSLALNSDTDGIDFEKPQVFQQNALNYFIENQTKIFDSLCQGVIEHYPNLIKLYGSVIVPDLKLISDVKHNISISTIHILGDEKDNFSYLGFDCGCTWDDEHGLGIVMHKERCIEIGQHDTAFMCYEEILKDKMTEEEWRIYTEERERQIAHNIAFGYEGTGEIARTEMQAKSKIEKKWWQFWK